jgi:hypothetical protein
MSRRAKELSFKDELTLTKTKQGKVTVYHVAA